MPGSAQKLVQYSQKTQKTQNRKAQNARNHREKRREWRSRCTYLFLYCTFAHHIFASSLFSAHFFSALCSWWRGDIQTLSSTLQNRFANNAQNIHTCLHHAGVTHQKTGSARYGSQREGNPRLSFEHRSAGPPNTASRTGHPPTPRQESIGVQSQPGVQKLS